MKYDITGTPFPLLNCKLESGECLITQRGSVVYRSSSVEMGTIVGKAESAISRMFVRESFFQNRYTAVGKAGRISVASSLPGEIKVVRISSDKPVIAQKRAFLASTKGVEITVFLQKRIATALFGGEGLFMQRLTGEGLAFLEIDGSCRECSLQDGQKITVMPGHLAMCDATCSIRIERTRGAKNLFFGGCGFFQITVTGPGKVVMQSMPVTDFADALFPYLYSRRQI